MSKFKIANEMDKLNGKLKKTKQLQSMIEKN